MPARRRTEPRNATMTETDAGTEDRAVPANDEVDELRRVLEDEKRHGLRLLADLQNFRRRAAQEHESARRDGQRAALLPMLAVLDALGRALATGSSDPAFYEGVASTHRLLLGALREAGAEPIPTIGHPFDARIHEAVSTVAGGDAPGGTVVGEARRGWRLGDELLRPAHVVVAADEEASAG